MKNILETKTLETQNNFIISLRNYLMNLYDTKHHYTFGEGNFEGKKIGNAYCLVEKDSNKPRDITGFCFRKNLLYFNNLNENQLLENICSFLLSKNIKIETQNPLTIKLSDNKYLINTHIGKGYADDISVSFMQLPSFKLN